MLFYLFDMFFTACLIYRGFIKAPEIAISSSDIGNIHVWPTYTILCPLYKEWNVLSQFITAMNDLEYPKNRLQVLLLLEEDDAESIRHLQSKSLPDYFEIVIVPHSLPKTKPKAMNYGLHLSRGEYIVVYDAEDIPHPLQLKKTVVAFQQTDPSIVCIQAKLNFYNAHQNFLTRAFAAEYSLWFELLLPGLQSLGAPIPLGGTSNHFRTSDLRLLDGWDSFNVTEDCDLGMRIIKHGFGTAIIDSTTLEEANSEIINWFGQRTRWIKGYIQTYFVHLRTIDLFGYNLKKPHAFMFHFIVGGKVASLLLNPFLWITTSIYFLSKGTALGDDIEAFFPGIVLYIAAVCFVFGNIAQIIYYMIGCIKYGHDAIVKYIFFIPLYWVCMSIAAWFAIYELITKPHYWSKTKHGLYTPLAPALAQARELIDEKLLEKSL